MEKNMSDDISARESKGPWSALWDLNREHPGALALALLLLYQKFTNPLLGRQPEPDAEGKTTLEPGKTYRMTQRRLRRPTRCIWIG
jgi:hypothetical protein